MNETDRRIVEDESTERLKTQKRTIYIVLLALALLLIVVFLCVSEGVFNLFLSRETDEPRIEPNDPSLEDSEEEEGAKLVCGEGSQITEFDQSGFIEYQRWGQEGKPPEGWANLTTLDFSSVDESGILELRTTWFNQEPTKVEILEEESGAYSIENPYRVFAIGIPLIIPDGRDVLDRSMDQALSPSGQGTTLVLGREVQFWIYSGTISGALDLDEGRCEFHFSFESWFDKATGLMIQYTENYPEDCGMREHGYITQVIDTSYKLGCD